MGRILARCFGLILLAFVVVTTTGLLLGRYYYDAPGPLQHETTIIIKRGTAFKYSIESLYRNGIIDHPSLFSLTALATNSAKRFKAGEYRFTPSISFREILQKLTSGDVVIRRFTIPEGLTTRQILAILNTTPGLEGAVTLPIQEGELLPETYHFTYGDRRNDIVIRMQKSMQKTLSQLWEKRQGNLPFANAEEALTLASIVEKETGLAAERPRIAAIFINRLRKAMPLQSDPTVIYALTEGEEDLTRPLTYNDLKFPSPYNTYMIQGLPPHPISHPGKAAIEAVLNPLETRELYFVSDGSGGHNFAETLQEHNRNVAAFRKKK